MSESNLSKLQALQANKKVQVDIDTRPAAEVMQEEAVGNADTKVIKVEEVNGKIENVVVETPEQEEEQKPKSNRGRKATRSETMVKFSYKVPKDLADTAKASLLRKGKKVQPIMTKLIENWIANPTELNIDQAYLDIPARQMKSTGFFMEQATINEFGAVVTENDTSMNLVVIHLYNEIVRGNY